MSNPYANWARRQSSRGPAPAVPTGVTIASMGAAAPASIPPAPAGFAWCMHPQAGLVLVPLEGASPIPSVQYPHTPPVARSHPGMMPPTPAKVETCLLVHPGNRDTYAELLATLPELAPPSGYDSMKGNPDPRVVAECQSCPEFTRGSDGAVHPESGLRARGDQSTVAPHVVAARQAAALTAGEN